MKVIDFDKVVSAIYDPKIKKVFINGAEFMYDGKDLYERQPIPKKEADVILEWFVKDEAGQYSPEDLKLIEEKIAEYEWEHKEQIELTISGKPAIPFIKERLDK